MHHLGISSTFFFIEVLIYFKQLPSCLNKNLIKLLLHSSDICENIIVFSHDVYRGFKKGQWAPGCSYWSLSTYAQTVNVALTGSCGSWWKVLLISYNVCVSLWVGRTNKSKHGVKQRKTECPAELFRQWEEQTTTTVPVIRPEREVGGSHHKDQIRIDSCKPSKITKTELRDS